MAKDDQCTILRFETRPPRKPTCPTMPVVARRGIARRCGQAYGLKTRKPHKVRLSKHAKAQAETVKKLKNIDPRLGKIRITKILKEMGYNISPSTITRILKTLTRSK